MSVVTLTFNPALDMTAEVDELVSYRTLRGELVALQPGGGGVNVARVLTCFDVPARAVFPAGGVPGATLVSELERDGVRIVPLVSAVARAAALLRRRGGASSATARAPRSPRRGRLPRRSNLRPAVPLPKNVSSPEPAATPER